MYKYCILSFENGIRRVTRVRHEWSQKDCELNFLDLEMQVNNVNEPRIISKVNAVDLVDYVEEKL